MECLLQDRRCGLRNLTECPPQSQSDLGPVLLTSCVRRKLFKPSISQVPSWQVSWLDKLCRIAECPSLHCDTQNLWNSLHRIQSPLCSSAVVSTCSSLSSLLHVYGPCLYCYVWAQKQLQPRHHILSMMPRWGTRLGRNRDLQPPLLCCLPGRHLCQTEE